MVKYLDKQLDVNSLSRFYCSESNAISYGYYSSGTPTTDRTLQRLTLEEARKEYESRMIHIADKGFSFGNGSYIVLCKLRLLIANNS